MTDPGRWPPAAGGSQHPAPGAYPPYRADAPHGAHPPYGAAALPGSPAAWHGQPVGPVPTGAFAWWAMFLAFIPLPGVGALVWLITTAALAFSSKHPRGSVARENARNGFSWAATYLLVVVASIAWAVFFSTFGAEPARYSGDENVGPLAVLSIVGVLAILLYAVLAWVHAIRGGVRAGRGQVYRAWGAIPFLRQAPTPR